MSHSASSLLVSFIALYPKLLMRARYRLGGGAEAEDLVQELYLRIAQRRPEHPVAHPQAYLHRAMDHLVHDHIRAEGRRPATLPPEPQSAAAPPPDAAAPDPGADVETRIDAARRLSCLGAALRALPPRQRQALTLARIEHLPHAEIARRMDISPSAVEKLIAKALRRCRLALSELEDR